MDTWRREAVEPAVARGPRAGASGAGMKGGIRCSVGRGKKVVSHTSDPKDGRMDLAEELGSTTNKKRKNKKETGFRRSVICREAVRQDGGMAQVNGRNDRMKRNQTMAAGTSQKRPPSAQN